MVNFIKKFFIRRELAREQREINKLYKKEGLTGKILERQIALNIRRNELDIADENTLNDEGFAQ